MEVVWTKDALSDYNQNIEFLIENWSEQVAKNFIDEVANVLNIIKLRLKMRLKILKL